MTYAIGSLVQINRKPGASAIGIVVGAGRSPGMVRVQLWRHNSARWTKPQLYLESQIVGPAPEGARQTKAIWRWLVDPAKPIPLKGSAVPESVVRSAFLRLGAGGGQ